MSNLISARTPGRRARCLAGRTRSMSWVTILSKRAGGTALREQTGLCVGACIFTISHLLGAEASNED